MSTELEFVPYSEFVANLPEATDFATGDKTVLAGSTVRKMDKDVQLQKTAENALGGIHSLSDTATEEDFVAGNYLVMDAPNVKKVPAEFMLAARDILIYSEFSLTGISEVGNVGTIRIKDFFVGEDDKLSVTIPNPTWNTSNIGGGQGYCFTCGYVENGNRIDVVAYTSGNLASHAGETVTLPTGHTNYYVGMRGNTGEVADFSLVHRLNLQTYVEKTSEKIINEGVVNFVGNGNTAIVVQIPVYGECSVEYTLPNAWPLTGVSSSAYVCIGGQYNVVTTENSDSYRTFKNRISANSMPNELGSTKTIQLTGTTKSFYLFLRAAVGESVSLTYKITQKSSVAEESNRTNIRDIQMLAQDPPNYSAGQYALVDNISRKTTATSSDFPADMVKRYSNGVELTPIVKNPGGGTWGQGIAISSDGFVINFLYSSHDVRLGISSLFDKSVGYIKSVSASGYTTDTPHCNFAFWGTEKYTSSDKYPLLYVGGDFGAADNSVAANVLVIRIVGDFANPDALTLSIVQKITFPASIGQVADAQVIGGNFYAIYGAKFTKFAALPPLSAGDTAFNDADILDSFSIPDLWTPNPIQCGCVVDGIYYAVHGSSTTGGIVVVNVSSKTGKFMYLPKFGEYEALFYYLNNFYVSNKITNMYGLSQALIVSKITYTFNE